MKATTRYPSSDCAEIPLAIETRYRLRTVIVVTESHPKRIDGFDDCLSLNQTDIRLSVEEIP
jgi:hypothetical protein